MKKIALIDGYGFVFRAYHSLPSLTRQDGTPVGAVFGFTNMLLKLIASLDITHIAVVFDSGSKTFRNDLYAPYKANRPPCPEDLIPQFPIIRECVESLNIATLEKVGFEADDIIATLAKKYADADYEVTIVSSDKDLMQLINDKVLMYDAMKNKIIGANEVYEKFAVKPEQVLDALSLIGDSSDNVPGVRGIGPKTASELINEFNNLENLYQNLHLIKQEKRRLALEENKDLAFLSKKLIKLDDNVELNITLDDLQAKGIEPNKLVNFLEQQGFKSLVYKVKKEFSLDDNQNAIINNSDNNNKNNDNNSNQSSNLENIERKHIEITDKNIIADIYQQAQKAGKIVIDYLIIDDEINFITLAPLDSYADNYTIYYYDFSAVKNQNFSNKSHNNEQIIDLLNFHSSVDSTPLNQILISDFDKIIFDHTIKKIFFNAKKFLRYYLNFLRRQKNATTSTKTMPEIIFDDVNLAQYLTNSSIKNSLRALIDNNLNINLEELGFGEKLDTIDKNNDNENFAQIFTDYQQKIAFFALTNYAISRLHAIFINKINDLKLHNCYLRLELPLLQVLAQIEHNGIGIDVAKLNELATEFSDKINILTQEIYHLSGCEFNIASSKQLAEILFVKLGIESAKKSKKTKELSTNVKVLEELANEGYEIAGKIMEYRKFSKLKNTYCDSLPKQISPLTKRIHTTLSSTSTLTGRLNSVNPNLQNIPIKSFEGKKIRQCFIAKKGNFIVSADYSQIELRILAHLAQLPKLIEAFNSNKDIHKITASEIFNIAEDLVTDEMRSKAKAINFGIIYGISAFGLARQLKISNSEAGEYIKSYFSKYAGIKEYMQQNIDMARNQGYVETISSRKCFINDINHKNPIIRQEAERQAINAPIQGSSADIIKKAMIQIHKRFVSEKITSQLILQIHDELLVEAPEQEIDLVKNILQQEMANCYKISIPLKIDFSVKTTW